MIPVSAPVRMIAAGYHDASGRVVPANIIDHGRGPRDRALSYPKLLSPRLVTEREHLSGIECCAHEEI